jgi:hypothetical protein
VIRINVNKYPHQKEKLSRIKDNTRVAVKGFEGLYEVDRNGNVYSIIQTISRRKRILKPYLHTGGYRKVNLYDKRGKCSKKYVHRLVAEAFIPNPENKPNVNYIDCNRENNKASNLEWCTQSENIKHAVKCGTYVSNLSNIRGGDAKCSR